MSAWKPSGDEIARGCAVLLFLAVALILTAGGLLWLAHSNLLPPK